MTENEKRLRESLGPSMLHHLELLLAEKAEERRAARAEALEEAAVLAKAMCFCQSDYIDPECNAHEVADRIRQRIHEPASIPVERVREVLRASRGRARNDAEHVEVEILSRRLGVPLDAAREYRCLRCHTPVTGHVLHSCKVTP